MLIKCNGHQTLILIIIGAAHLVSLTSGRVPLERDPSTAAATTIAATSSHTTTPSSLTGDEDDYVELHDDEEDEAKAEGGHESSPSRSTKATDSKKKKKQKLIVILADGIRYDYLDREPNLTNFAEMARNGVRAEYVEPIFPANSYPNWYTILTGLYAESHGMVQNFMFDPAAKEYFYMFPHPNASHAHWWNESEPIWITAEKQGAPAAVYWWDGCQVVIHGAEPSHCVEYQNYWTWPRPQADTLDAILEILDGFEADDYRLGLVYYEAVDAMGHAFGPESRERREAMQDLDSLLGKLNAEIARRGLGDEVNIMVVSDHGMLNIETDDAPVAVGRHRSHDDHNGGGSSSGASEAHPKATSGGFKTKLIDIDKILSVDDVDVMLDRGSVSFLYPRAGRLEKVLADLKRSRTKGLNYYRREDLPERYHIARHRRVAPVVLVADKGFFLRGFPEQGKTKPVWDVLYPGHHGYDPTRVTEMRTIFYGRGPGLARGHISAPLSMTDHYNLMCHVLGLRPRPNNGSWDRVSAMAADPLGRERFLRVDENRIGKLIVEKRGGNGGTGGRGGGPGRLVHLAAATLVLLASWTFTRI